MSIKQRIQKLERECNPDSGLPKLQPVRVYNDDYEGEMHEFCYRESELPEHAPGYTLALMDFRRDRSKPLPY
jgi:hypothetical protein